MADLSRDAGLIEAFNSGEDLHSFVAARVFGVPAAEVTPAMRSKVKAMSYGLAYGLSAFGLSKQLRIAVDEARTLMEDYFDRFGGVRDYLQSVVAEARRNGYTETILGRRRVPARPDQRQPAAPGDGRADGAQRTDPGLGGRHHQGRHARRRPPTAPPRGCAPGCCSRCTTNSCSRSRRASGRPSRHLVRSAMGGAAAAVGAAGGLGRRRPQLARGRRTETTAARSGLTHALVS